MKTKQTKSTKSVKSPRSAKNARPAVTMRGKSETTTQAAPTPSKFPITVSNPSKIFWPDEGYTKLQLIEFYADTFPKLQPYVKDRILSRAGHRMKAPGVGLLSGGYAKEELEHASAHLVYDDPPELLENLAELEIKEDK